VCADCPDTTLVTAEEMRRRGLPLPDEMDTRRFVRAGTAEDPLTAEALGAALEAEQVPVFVRPRRAGSVDMLTSGSPTPWWEILVPEEHLATATELVAREKARIEAAAPEAERAADEESQLPVE
jgi:hypothetical protein